MNEELIKRLRFMGDASNGSVDHRTIMAAADALEALSRPAPAVQVPEGMVLVSSDAAEEAADHLRDAAATLKARHSPIEGEWGKYSIDKQARREHDDMLRVAAMLAAAPAPSAAAVQVPEGYRLAPVELSEAQISAVLARHPGALYGYAVEFAADYRAALDAAEEGK